ncbi:MAG: flagellar motor protein MotB [Halomonas sp.]
MVEENKTRPIVIKKVAKHEEGHHGGSWKIAFADFMTAMFAIFLVLWLLLALDDEQRAGIGQYFRDPSGVDASGSEDVIEFEGQRSDPIDLEGMPIGIGQEGWLEREELQEVAEAFQEEVLADPELSGYADQILLDITDDGLRIQLVDAQDEPMFELGSAEPREQTREILTALAQVLEDVPNPVSLAGHTDARRFTDEERDNWTLSAARANAARRTLLEGGLSAERIGQVVGYADTMPFDPEDPRAAVNRRISVVLMSRSAVEDIAERERRMDAGEHALDVLPRQPRELLTPEERRTRQEIDDSRGQEAPSGTGEQVEPEELPPRQDPSSDDESAEEGTEGEEETEGGDEQAPQEALELPQPAAPESW